MRTLHNTFWADENMICSYSSIYRLWLMRRSISSFYFIVRVAHKVQPNSDQIKLALLSFGTRSLIYSNKMYHLSCLIFSSHLLPVTINSGILFINCSYSRNQHWTIPVWWVLVYNCYCQWEPWVSSSLHIWLSYLWHTISRWFIINASVILLNFQQIF